MSEKKEVNELNPEESEKVSGGYVYQTFSTPYTNYKVIDDKDGKVLGRYNTMSKAKEMARRKGQDDTEISYAALSDLRTNDENESKYGW